MKPTVLTDKSDGAGCAERDVVEVAVGLVLDGAGSLMAQMVEHWG
jgi:hypothetical protein